MERPILFNTEMVLAILKGRKTQTRRLVKPQPTPCEYKDGHWWPSNDVYSMVHVEDELQDYEGPWGGLIESCNPFGQIGDQLWVRETWRKYDCDECPCYEYCNCPPHGTYLYYADCLDDEAKWKPSIHMPRSASRIHLEITNIRIERLNDISEADAIAEGCDNSNSEAAIHTGWYEKPVRSFQRLWESIKGEDSWKENPWVWVVEFKQVAALRGIKG